MSIPSPEEVITGLVERVTYHNAENGFCVLRVNVKGHKDLVTIIGNLHMISAGEFVQASGSWTHDRQHGNQFKAQFLKSTPPTSLEGIERYLASGIIKGVGPVYAKKLIAAFGVDVFEVIEASPERLRQVTGIGQSRATQIIKGWADQRIIRDIMLFLHSHKISTARAVRIYKIYGARAIELITLDPYRLARDIRGIGFVSADTIAQQIGIEKNSLLRARAGIAYALTKAMDDGHCGLSHHLLLTSVQELLDIPYELVVQALNLELDCENVVQEVINKTNCVFLSGLFQAEKAIAKKLMTLTQSPLPWSSIDAGVSIKWVEEQTAVSLSQTQKQAIEIALTSKILVITGGPGVGKTTLVNSILKILETKKLRIALAAPTGRAAKRLFECTGMEAKTLHRLLETNPIKGGFSKNENSPLACDLLIIDETSMVDVPLMHAVMKALPKTSALILVGDIDQLPSVGPGQVLSDLIQSNMIPVIRLTEVFRQASTSQIITASHTINQGLMPELKVSADEESDFYFIQANTPEDALDKIIKMLKERIPMKFGFSPFTDIQVLCPMGPGIVGTKNLNVELQKVLNPPTDQSISRFGWSYSVGDKVMQVENNYDKSVYNGDIGVITAISHEESEVVIAYDDKLVVYEFGECDEIVLAYATTIHKSQGSEYPAVIIPLVMQHYSMLKRNLIYTSITRGKKLVIVIGEKKALTIAVKQRGEQRRWSSLKLRLKELKTVVPPILSSAPINHL
jgi:exodeoxyribonuclease V alpha subunit